MKNRFKTYLGYIFKETRNYQIYLSAACIGLAICFLTDHYSIIPFMVPFLVQIVVRSNIQFRNRHQQALIELPAQTEDPAFIMDQEGTILLSIGKTKAAFDRYGVHHISDFIDEEISKELIETAFSEEKIGYAGNRSMEAFSDKTFKWYEIKAQGIAKEGKAKKILVWFQDISLRKIYHLRLRDLLRYSDSLIQSLGSQNKDSQAEYDHFASFILKEYEAVFISRSDSENNLTGFAFKNQTEGRVKSKQITIHKESLAPINISRIKKQILTRDAEDYTSDDAFIEDNPFDKKVLSFIDFKIRNYITYNEADISVIAFNFRSSITAYEKQFFEIVVNIYRTMVVLVDLDEAAAGKGQTIENQKTP